MYRNQKGVALLIGMIVTLAIVGLSAAYMLTSFSYNSYQESEAYKKVAEYRAIDASEKIRNFLYNSYRNPPALGLSLNLWLASIRDGTNDLGLTAPPLGKFLYRSLAPVTATQGYTLAYPFDDNHSAWVTAVSAADSSTHWVEIESYGKVDGHGGNVGSTLRSTVVQRISFGKANIFQNAVLTKTVNCMACHLQVRGDVGVLGFFRPGWGTEGSSGGNSGDQSFITGDIYASSFATDSALKQPSQTIGPNNGYYLSSDGQTNLEAFGGNYFDGRRVDQATTTGNFKINGLQTNGNLYTTAENIKDRLPQDEDGNGERDFPNVDPNKAKKGANGTLAIAGTSGGKIYEVPPTDVYTGAVSQQVTGVAQTSTGSIVLIGTASDPIQLNGDVFIEGDVMIKGYVSGKGAIYSGRNVYVLGDIIYKNQPTAYKNSSDPDADAAADVAAGTADELRLAARNGIVIGDFTRDNDAGTAYLPISKRQGQDFMNAQFALGGTGYFREGTGEELTLESGTYYNDLRETIPATEVTNKSGDSYYDAAIMPVKIDASGTSSFWINQAQTRSLIGTENLTFNSWRGTVSGTTAAKTATLVANGFTSGQAASILAGGINFNGGNYFVRKDGSTYRVIRDISLPYTTAVSRIDAFLYATKRVAGKVSGKNLVINGGIISEKMGILAPGRKQEWWMGNSRYATALDSNILNTFNDEKYGAMSINYDYRLRNGGLGFALL
ncbi:MAG: hypothetical protein AABZ60_22245, partial [Planctomycetota bacterium]